MPTTKKSDSIRHTMARKWKFLDATPKSLQPTFNASHTKFHERQKELMRIEQEILGDGVRTLSDSLGWDGRERSDEELYEINEQHQDKRSSGRNLNIDTKPKQIITVTDSSPSPKTQHFGEQDSSRSHPSTTISTTSRIQRSTPSAPGSTLTPGSPRASLSPLSPLTSRSRKAFVRRKSSIASDKRSKISAASSPQDALDMPRLEFTGLTVLDVDLGGSDGSVVMDTTAASKVVAVPKFKTLHPLSQIEECVDFPVELRVDNYEEDPTFAKYRKRLTEDLDNKVYTKKQERLRRIDGYGTWYVPPQKWNEHMKTLLEKKRAAMERRGEDMSDNTDATAQDDMHNTATDANDAAAGAGGSTRTLEHAYFHTTSVVAAEGATKMASGKKPNAASSPVHVDLPPTVQVAKSHLPPLDEDKQLHLEKLHSSRRFKEYLIKTHSTIPEWLAKVSVSEIVVEEARLGPMDNTAIPQALRRVNYGNDKQSNPAALGQIQKKKVSKSMAGLENGVAEYSGSGISIQGPSGGKKKETPMQRNKNDLRYISQFMKRVNLEASDPNRQKRPFHEPLLPELNPNEEQHPDPASRPRRAIPLSTMIRLTTERRKKYEEERLKALDQSTLQFSS